MELPRYARVLAWPLRCCARARDKRGLDVRMVERIPQGQVDAVRPVARLGGGVELEVDGLGEVRVERLDDRVDVDVGAEDAALVGFGGALPSRQKGSLRAVSTHPAQCRPSFPRPSPHCTPKFLRPNHPSHTHITRISSRLASTVSPPPCRAPATSVPKPPIQDDGFSARPIPRRTNEVPVVRRDGVLHVGDIDLFLAGARVGRTEWVCRRRNADVFASGGGAEDAPSIEVEDDRVSGVFWLGADLVGTWGGTGGCDSEAR
ncbi:hypothetical protein FIBSPDRAFT_1047062 [Athelia psychrophila]|uniref:Uncharacterized protein n=1 Tax=Athelia psychrophila TaxID=1759441 RepID=A0A166FSE5_9AGAM|nr:hypothetical protein FIBSPDRAFT_1047062 [Fibularhizoctonia sp. CBS 109695]